MSVMENFSNGLIVTGLGMGLVFLTLIIVMYCIKLLDWAFRPKPEVAAAAPSVPLAASPLASAPPESAAEDSVAQVAAIAVALALSQARSQPATREWTGVRPVSAFDIDYTDEILGEVVTVTSIDPGPGTWKGYGRLKALQ